MEAESSKMATARPSRARKKLKIEMTSDEDPAPVEHKIRRPQRKGNIGKLAGLIDLPLDVLFEIFGSLRPFDLLRLARTTKEFRRLLMHKSAISVWKSALSQVPGLPDCLPGMCEPQWVNLVFDPHCHFCFTPGVRTVEWRFRMRICGKCAKEHLSDRIIPEGASYQCDGPMFSTLVPSRPSRRGRRTYMIRDYRAVEKEYNAIIGKEANEEYVKERKKIVKEIESHAILCELWLDGQTRDRSVELQQLRDERRLAIIKKLEELGYGRDVESILYPDSLEDHKLVKQPQRLTERIWTNIRGPLIEFMQEMRKKRLAREHKALVVERKQSAVEVLRTFKNAQLPYTEIMPEAPDFCDFGPIKAILEQPSEVTVDDSSFTDILPILPDLMASWRQSINVELITVLKNSNNRRRRRFSLAQAMLVYMGFDDGDGIEFDDDIPEDDDTPLLDDDVLSVKVKLATTVFRCTRCTNHHSFLYDDFSMYSDDGSAQPNPLFYPEVLGHRCLTRSHEPLWPWDSRGEFIKRLDNYSRTREKWDTCHLQLDVRMGKMVEAVLEVAKMDPAATTPRDMDDLGGWFACLKCAIPRTAKTARTTVYGWRDAVVHQDRHKITGSMEGWRMLTAEEAEEARISSLDTDPDDVQHKHWLCVHCRDLPTELKADELDMVVEHLQNKHDIASPDINKDYYRNFAAEPAFPAPFTIALEIEFADALIDDDDFPDTDDYEDDYY